LSRLCGIYICIVKLLQPRQVNQQGICNTCGPSLQGDLDYVQTRDIQCRGLTSRPVRKRDFFSKWEHSSHLCIKKVLGIQNITINQGSEMVEICINHASKKEMHEVAIYEVY
jgi:hypothetical protein